MSDQEDNVEKGAHKSDNEQNEGSSMEVGDGVEDQEIHQTVSSVDNSSSEASNSDLVEIPMDVEQGAQGTNLTEIASDSPSTSTSNQPVTYPGGARPKTRLPKKFKKPKGNSGENLLDEMEACIDEPQGLDLSGTDQDSTTSDNIFIVETRSSTVNVLAQPPQPSGSYAAALISPRIGGHFFSQPERADAPLLARGRASLSNERMIDAAAGLGHDRGLRRPMPAGEREYKIWLQQMRNVFNQRTRALNDAYLAAWRGLHEQGITDEEFRRIYRYMATEKDEGVENEDTENIINIIRNFDSLALNMVYIRIVDKKKYPDNSESSSSSSNLGTLSYVTDSSSDINFYDSRSITEASGSVFEHSENDGPAADNLQLPGAVAPVLENSGNDGPVEDNNLQQPYPLLPPPDIHIESTDSVMSGPLEEDTHRTENESEHQSNLDSNASGSSENIDSLSSDETPSLNHPLLEESSHRETAHAKLQTTQSIIESTSQFKKSRKFLKIPKVESTTSKLSRSTHSGEKRTLTSTVSKSDMSSEAMEVDLVSINTRENYGSISEGREQSRTHDQGTSVCSETAPISADDKRSICECLGRLLGCGCKPNSSESSGSGNEEKCREDKFKAAGDDDTSSESETSDTSNLKRPSDSPDENGKWKSKKTE